MKQHAKAPELTADQINALFEAVEFKLNPTNVERYRERWIFEQVLGESPNTIKKMFEFTKNVTTCPTEVILWCQEFLVPKLTTA